MASEKYHRAQAELATRLAAAAADPQIADAYNRMARQQLAKANAVDPSVTSANNPSGMSSEGRAAPPAHRTDRSR